MASCYILKRPTKGGEPRYHVRFEAGRDGVQVANGSTRRVLHVGVFDTEKRAKERRRWALDEWAAGRVPDPAGVAKPIDGVTVEEAAKQWLASRIDVAAMTRVSYAQKAARIADDFPALPCDALSEQAVRLWIGRMVDDGAKPATVAAWMNVLRQILDFAGVDPNPARNRRVKLPRIGHRGRERLPNAAELAMIRAAFTNDVDRLILDFLEQTGVRMSGVVALTWGDVDAERRRFHIRETKTKSSLRWVRDDPPIAPVEIPERPAYARDSDRVYPRTAYALSLIHI